MKQAKKYIIVFIIFLILMIFVLLFFMYKYNRNSIISQSNELLNDLNALKEGKYNYKNGFFSEEPLDGPLNKVKKRIKYSRLRQYSIKEKCRQVRV